MSKKSIRISKIKPWACSKQRAENILKNLGTLLLKLMSLGDPADKIIEFANGENMDLIITGNVGLRGI